MRFLSALIVILIAIVGVSFALLNAQAVELNYYIGQKEIPLSMLIVGVFILGILVGLIMLLPKLLKLKLEIRRLHRNKEIKEKTGV